MSSDAQPIVMSVVCYCIEAICPHVAAANLFTLDKARLYVLHRFPTVALGETTRLADLDAKMDWYACWIKAIFARYCQRKGQGRQHPTAALGGVSSNVI
jgi:hypothetical protein